jgi:hypothetical protein
MWVCEYGKKYGSETSLVIEPCLRGNLGSKTLDVGRSREKRWIRASQIILTPCVGLSP